MLGGSRGNERLPDLAFQPDLAVALVLVVLEELERRVVHRGHVLAERGQQPDKLAALVEPETYSRPLLVLKALRQLVDEGIEDHHTTFATRSTPAFCRGAMLAFTPSSRSGSQPLGRSSGAFQGVRIR